MTGLTDSRHRQITAASSLTIITKQIVFTRFLDARAARFSDRVPPGRNALPRPTARGRAQMHPGTGAAAPTAALQDAGALARVVRTSARFWSSAPAERSGDGALDFRRTARESPY